MKPLKEISARLKIAKSKVNNANTKNSKMNSSNLGNAFKISTEFVAAVVVGSTIGFILDNLFGTKPWLIIIFFIIGVIAGMFNVIRSAKLMQKKQ
jgi:ATP synthase protein I